MKNQPTSARSLELDYSIIIKKVWKQFQSGQSMFAKEGPLAHWTMRTITIDGEEIDSSLVKNFGSMAQSRHRN